MSLLEALGIRVREVADLDEGAVWVCSHQLLLVDSDLSESARETVVCQMLGVAASA